MSSIDQSAVKQIEAFGYPKEHIKKSLKDESLNHITTTYYLLAKH